MNAGQGEDEQITNSKIQIKISPPPPFHDVINRRHLTLTFQLHFPVILTVHDRPSLLLERQRFLFSNGALWRSFLLRQDSFFTPKNSVSCTFRMSLKSDGNNKDLFECRSMVNEEEEEGERVGAFLRREVPDWDDPVKAVARFKGFSGQRSDWEGRYLFWRELILKVAQHLGTFIIRPSRLNDVWFRREGALSPLCLPQVLLEMYEAGDILKEVDLTRPASGTLSMIFRKAVNALSFSSLSSSATPKFLSDDYYVLTTLLKDKALEVIKILSESHWTSSCVITFRKFKEICGGSKEASAILSYLSGSQKAKYLIISRNDAIEGLKVSLSPEAVSDITSLDYDVLHLTWTAENLEQQLHVIDQRCQKSRGSAVACLRSGNRKLALRHAKELKVAYESREKCTILLNRVEEVLRVIGDIESSRKVTEAIKLGAKAMRDNGMSIEEVELSLEDLKTSVESLREVEEVLGAAPAGAEIEDEDIEDELKMLEMDIGGGSTQEPNADTDVGETVALSNSAGAPEASETVDTLSDSISKLSIKSRRATEAV
ncbi:OLC1v1015418C1 [Oldenlandia corymbosa var. corymbosa]|uniref:OLC1v1015418C1 n=1 Tax=Oldenlandia corymbosa var. corymbosa TaxID=529605 RepID=A0AAV1E406_OLDCO|nr:OLC1v1015418C1 [Oldenlandia corymbosa var. corymbosa]